MTRLLAGALAFACFLSAQTRTIDDFFRDFTAEWIRQNPNSATSNRYFTGEEQDRLERQITPETRAWKLDRIHLAQRGLKELSQFQSARLTDLQRVSAELLKWQLETVAGEEPFLDYTFPLQQMNGANVGLVERITLRHPMATVSDAKTYLAALGQVATRMNEAIAESEKLAARNIIPPKFILQATIQQMQSFSDPSPAENSFVSTYVQKVDKIPALSDEQREQYRARAEQIVAKQVYPAWKKAIATLQAQLPKSTDEAGISRLKGGADAYAYFLRRYTTTHLTAEQIHELGLKEVARIEAEMETILKKLGRTEGPLTVRIEKLKQDLGYPKTEDGRTQIMADVDGILRDAQKRSALLFDKTPKSPVIARAFPRFLETNAAANYNMPSSDGTRPGIFQIPLRPERMTRFGLRTLVYHETVPGHHFQLALQTENKDLPRFRQIGAFGIISAQAEGWGLYAERLAAESGWYEGDLEGQLGQLDSALFRARRLVVDTGLHAKHWTRQQAIDYGIETSEVERYVVFPGQACSYMIGQLKIVELREKARKALGDKFSLREFHNVVLDTGMVPLELLESQVDSYIARAKR